MGSATNWTKLNWEDPFELDAQLTEEQRMVRESARQYAQDRLAPRVTDAFRSESTDPAIFREMGERSAYWVQPLKVMAVPVLIT